MISLMLLFCFDFRPVPSRDFDDCDSEKQTQSLTSSEKESKKTGERSSEFQVRGLQFYSAPVGFIIGFTVL